ncbi:MAG: methyltransferase, partial [Oscillospiraceae bacterium]|nr:methyltransferase [Oscillospiraceae bacterium]
MGVVSSTASIPVPDSCADLLLNIFSPLFPKEFHRVLKSNGKMLRVIPQEKHLIELKEVVYEKAYLNPHDTGEVEEFEIKNKAEVNYKVDITNQNDIKALFQMTPYYYKTGEKDQNKLNDLDSLSITFSFGVFLYDRVGT